MVSNGIPITKHAGGVKPGGQGRPAGLGRLGRLGRGGWTVWVGRAGWVGWSRAGPGGAGRGRAESGWWGRVDGWGRVDRMGFGGGGRCVVITPVLGQLVYGRTDLSYPCECAI
jgi:hypothetical protein